MAGLTIAAKQLPPGPLKGHGRVKVWATNHIQKEEFRDLSIIDNMMPRIRHGTSMCFKLNRDADHRIIFERLIESVGSVFEHMPIWISEPIAQDPIGKNFKARIGPDTYCHFYYREHSDDPKTQKLFANLETNHFNLSEYTDESPLHPPEPDEGEPNTWLRIQCNFFPEGLIIVFSAFHVALDLITEALSIAKWSECTTQTYEGGVEPVDHLPAECHDRSLLSKGNADIKIEDMPENHIFDITQMPQPEEERMSVVIFHFSSQNLTKLKKYASPTSDPNAWISTADALEALMWRHVIRARDGASKEAPKTHCKILSGMNMRGRMAVSLEPEYVGAATAMAPLELPRSLLHSAAPGALNEIAYFVRKSLSSWDCNRYMTGMMGLWPKLKTEEMVWFKDPGELLFTDHSAFPCYVTNWGPDLGSPVCWREPYIQRAPPKGEVMVLPKLLDGSLEVMATMEPEAMRLLIRDPEFRQFADVLCVCNDGGVADLLPPAGKAKL